LCDAVVGNPPFIRYQSFSGSTREKALARAAHQGVKLSSLVSSWAPFLVHSCAMLKRGGNLAMVIPMEIGHATYARPVLDYLSRAFARTTFLTFRVPLFPDLSQDTLLLLAERKGGQFEGLGWQDMSSLADLGTLDRTFKDRQVLDHGALASGDDRFITSFIDTRARDLYRELSSSADTAQLSELAQVGIGYVTGANDFFHLSSEDVAAFQIPLAIATRAVFRGRALTGLTFTESDWLAGADSGSAGYLLEVSPRTTLDDKTRSYVSYGVSIGVDKAYKCRVRSPWYSVPNVYRPEAFLTYMSGLRPRLVVNSAAVVAPNTLHTVRMRPLASLSPISLALAWQSSLASLSVEIEGHAMGGGMLKLEPKEAQKVVVPVAKGGTPDLRTEVDGLLRAGRNDTARQLVDETVLQNGLGLSAADCELLGAAAEQLRVRRYYRGRQLEPARRGRGGRGDP